jgi:hypothetical protein
LVKLGGFVLIQWPEEDKKNLVDEITFLTYFAFLFFKMDKI